MSEQQWWYLDGKTKVGPKSIDEMKGCIHSGEIDRDTLVWVKGYESWIRSKDSSDLSSLFHDVPPPIPEPVIKKATGAVASGVKSIINEPKGLGGFLIFWWIGLILGFLFFLIPLGEYYDLTGTYPGMRDSVRDVLKLNVALGVVNSIYAGYVFILFTGKNINFPTHAMWLLVYTFVSTTLFYILWYKEGLTSSEDLGIQIFSKAIGVCVWSWYLLTSRRVKNTFVTGQSGNDISGSVSKPPLGGGEMVSGKTSHRVAGNKGYCEVCGEEVSVNYGDAYHTQCSKCAGEVDKAGGYSHVTLDEIHRLIQNRAHQDYIAESIRKCLDNGVDGDAIFEYIKDKSGLEKANDLFSLIMDIEDERGR